jgi:drug/metabolite transporter (DMT)-like permease
MPSIDRTKGVQTRGATAGAILRVVVAGGCWGLAAVFAKTAFDRGVPPVRMAEARVLVALAFLLAIVGLWRRDLLRPTPGTAPALVAFGLSTALVNACYYIAIDRLPVGVAISIQYTAPALLLGVAAITAARKPDRVAWLAAGLTLAGAVLVSEAFRGLKGVDGIGLLAALASAILFASYLTTAEVAGRKGTHPATTLLWGFIVAVAAWAMAAPWWSWPVAKLGEPEVALSVLGVGVVGTLIPFFLAVGAVRVLSPATAGIAATSEPPFAAAFAWILLGQHLSVPQILGGLLVVAGVILAQRAAAVPLRAVPMEVTP